ncbi:AcrR family transcriptional regulator [Alkalihalobacillus xiaoxiensis]|uniref:AcrR family transcriptional regulator n=1 Tax=Shouchella xiaoxiensis TaxID=766895 RepID=A0ABS2SXI5_9BACI|nr:TetR/AcrR family transcriptional regulator [Shouchella xiaoxiensis]MBM7839945.1 AcrR family transcriptional regulator [Shouchella xiaoxiensis]
MTLKIDKKDKIIESAVSVFADDGYHKATTKKIALAAGVTQPYIFHFFRNKEDLFIHVIDYSYNRIHQTFMEVDAPADKLIETMGQSFVKMLETHRKEVLMVMQAYTIAETVIREHSALLYTRMFDDISAKLRKKGIQFPEQIASNFIGTGLLITVSEVLGLPQLRQPSK